jgi:hypothetical protein
MTGTIPIALKFQSISSRGDKINERIHFEVWRDADLSFYVLIATAINGPSQILAGNRTCYWFPPRAVKPGDTVCVYTKPGNNASGAGLAPNGHTMHFAYWGSSTPLFGDRASRVVIAEINTWVTGE